jgi:membrane fusion protein (multidrug efflux system)
MKNKPVWIAMALLLLGVQFSCRSAESRKNDNPNVVQPLVVRVAKILRKEWIVTAPISGTLRSLSTVDIKPEVGGRLNAVYFEEGDYVKKDQLMAEIDPSNYKLSHDQAVAALAVAQAALDKARVSLEHARTEKERADNLLRSGGVTQKDHQAAVTAVKETESSVRLAEAQCEQARAATAVSEKSLKDCRLFAPAAGHVQKKFFDKGSLLAPGTGVYTLVDNSKLEMECVIPSYQLALLRIGQKANFKTPTWGERLFNGVVSAINPVIESDNRSVKIKLRIDNSGGELRTGMYAAGEITAGRESQAIVIPRDSLIPENDARGAALYLVKDGKAHRVEVEIGGLQQDRAWIRRGLADGDMLITEIGPSLKDGIPVQPQ